MKDTAKDMKDTMKGILRDGAPVWVLIGGITIMILIAVVTGGSFKQPKFDGNTDYTIITIDSVKYIVTPTGGICKK